MTNLMKIARPKRIVLTLVLLLIGAGMLVSVTAFGYIQTVTDDYGISIAPLAQDCGANAVWDATINQCVLIYYADD